MWCHGSDALQYSMIEVALMASNIISLVDSWFKKNIIFRICSKRFSELVRGDFDAFRHIVEVKPSRLGGHS